MIFLFHNFEIHFVYIFGVLGRRVNVFYFILLQLLLNKCDVFYSRTLAQTNNESHWQHQSGKSSFVGRYLLVLVGYWFLVHERSQKIIFSRVAQPRVEICFSLITSESKIGIRPKTNIFSFYFMLKMNLKGSCLILSLITIM